MKFAQNIIFIVSFLFILVVLPKNSEAKVIKIGTGSKDALAYPILLSICEIFNQHHLSKGESCEVFSTAGSEDNLSRIVTGKYDAGVIKSDMEYNAYNGIGVFAGKPYRELRTVIGLHQEYLTIIIKNSSNIKELKDVKGKRIYIGNKGSGSRLWVDKLFSINDWKNSDFRELSEESADKIYNLFCNNKVDAAIYLIGHPNNIFINTLKDCDAKLIGFSRKEIEKYVDVFRYISPAMIKKGTYPNQKQDINTFASQLLLAASSNLDEKLVYDLVKIISENGEKFRTKNPALKGTSFFGSEMAIIPLHNGSLRYQKNQN